MQSVASRYDAGSPTVGSLSPAWPEGDGSLEGEGEHESQGSRASSPGLSGDMSPPSSVISSPKTVVDKPPSKEVSGGMKTVHQQPNWLQDLKKSFHAKVFDICSARTREAVGNNEYIEVGFNL